MDGDRKRLLAKNKELQRLLEIAKSEFLAGEGPASASIFDSFAGQTGGMGASFAGHKGGVGASFTGKGGGSRLDGSSRFNGAFDGVAQVSSNPSKFRHAPNWITCEDGCDSADETLNPTP